MTVVAALRTLVGVVEFNGGDWADEWYPELVNQVPDNLLKMRRIRLRSFVLHRIEQAAEPLTLEHALKRIYSDMRGVFGTLASLKTPFLDAMKKDGTRSMEWGKAVYFDVVTQPDPRAWTKPRFWRDPFTVTP